MSTTILAAKSQLLAAFLKYADWNSADSAPYDIALGSKMEANQPGGGEPPAVTFPVLTVEVGNPIPSRKFGRQQELEFTVRVTIIYHYASGEQPETLLEELTGSVVWNIMQSYTLEAQWIGLDWVADIPRYSMQPADNALARFLLLRGIDQDADGGGFTASMTDFVVVTYEGDTL